MKRYKVILLLWLSFYLIITYIAISKDKAPWTDDCSVYYTISIKYYNELSPPSFKTPINLYRIEPRRHSIFMLFSAPFYFFFGTSPSVALSTNLFFLVILMLSIYGIGKYIMNEYTGILSASLVMLFPGISALSRMYYIDFSLLAIVSLSMYLLLKTNQFQNLKYCILLGLSIALGMLIKIPYIVYILGPFIYTIRTSLRKKSIDVMSLKKRNIIVSTILGISLPLIWYLPRADLVIKRLFHYAITFGYITSPHQNPYGKELFTYLFINSQTSLFFLSVFILCLYYYIRTHNKNKTFLLLWIFVPLISFSLIPHRDFRYIAPILPAISIIISTAILSIKKFRFKQITVCMVLLVGLLQYYIFTYNPNLFYLKTSFLRNPIVKFLLFGWGDERYYYTYPPVDNRNWHIMDIIETIKKSSDLTAKEKEIEVRALSMSSYVWTLGSYAYALNLPLSFLSAGYRPLNSLDIDFVIIQENGYLAPDYGNFMSNINQSRVFFEKHIDEFKLIKIFILPDESKISIYKKK